LLEDHLVDLLLDVAASGENVVEREGLSVRHPAKFVLIGSGNPEEGELRPQLLDRFGLSVEVKTPGDIETRIEIMRLVAEQERDPEAFAEKWAEEDEAILKRVARGKARLAKLVPGDDILRDAAQLCFTVGADGLRGELTLMRAARALAALQGAKAVRREHLLEIAPSALRHRLRRDVLDETGSTARITRAIDELFG
ncbi:MAG: magnesium chelatase ATPase subunit I, partial [Pseudomonadota bacterium]